LKEKYRDKAYAKNKITMMIKVSHPCGQCGKIFVDHPNIRTCPKCVVRRESSKGCNDW